MVNVTNGPWFIKVRLYTNVEMLTVSEKVTKLHSTEERIQAHTDKEADALSELLKKRNIDICHNIYTA